MTDNAHVPPGLTPHILPGILREVAEVAGMQAAVDLCVAARGRRFYIPHSNRLTKDHPLVQAVGRVAARRIAKVLGGQAYPVPTARPVLRAYRARVLRTAGYTASQIALILDMDRSQVQRLAPSAEYPTGDAFNYPHPAGPRVTAAPASNPGDLQPVGIERCSGGADGHGIKRMDRG